MAKDLIEPSLNIIFGPPAVGEQRIMFNLYQQGCEENDDSKRKAWEEFERSNIDFLFHRENDGPSAIDELLTKLHGVTVRISGYKMLSGFHKGFHVIGVAIQISCLLVGQPNITWPPDEEICDDVANMIGYILTREWVRWFSILP